MEHLSFSNTFGALRRQLNLNSNPMSMPDFNFSDSDLCCDFGNDPEPRFLDEYTEEDFHKILRENGFIDDLKSMGYSQTILRMECKDKFVHRLSLLDRSLMTSVDQPITEKNFLMDMFMRKKDLFTYQLKAYQDLKYRANHMQTDEAEILDASPDVPEKHKFKPDYLRNDNEEKKKEKTLKLRNLSDFSKVENKLADNLKEADVSSKKIKSNIVLENEEVKNISSSPSKSSSINSNHTGFSMYSFGRSFALNRNPNPPSSHGSTVDVDVIEVSSSSSYSEDEEKKENINNPSGSYDTDADDEKEESKSDLSESSLKVEMNVTQDSEQGIIKTNLIGDKINDKKLPLDPNIERVKHGKNHIKKVNKRKNLVEKNKDFLKVKNEDDKKNKRTSLDFSSFINNLTTGTGNGNKPPMTASSVINSIFSFLNNSIKEEKPIAPVLNTPASPPLPESSQESAPELSNTVIERRTRPSYVNEYNNSDNDNTNNNDNNSNNNNDTNQKNIETTIISPMPVHAIPSQDNILENNNDNNSNNNNNNISENNKNDTVEHKESIPILKINNDDIKVSENQNENKNENENENKNEVINGEEKDKDNQNSSVHSNNSNIRSNARMDMSLQPTSSEEVRKRKLTPLLVSKKGASVLIKFLERNINVVPEMKITEIEWVCMQNPRGTFTTKRPQCPGQRFPGLKMGRKISNLMISLAKLKGRDGLCDTPEHFHNAAIYSQKGYMFINPAFHGYFVSLLFDLNKDMREHGLAAVSWAFKLGHVINRRTKKPEFWHPEEQIYPTSDRLHKYFISDQYLALVEHYRKIHLGRVYIDWNEAKECLAYSIKIEEIQHLVYSSDDDNEDDNKKIEENKKNEEKENNKEENKKEDDKKENNKEEHKKEEDKINENEKEEKEEKEK